jgi:hypothetical protein
VIIFTHDLVFLSLMMTNAEAIDAPVRAHWLERDGIHAGNVKADDAPYLSKAYRSTATARSVIQRAKAAHGSARVALLKDAAGKLRRCLEEIVPSFMFNGIIERWRENLMLTKLRAVKWDQELAGRVQDLFEELSHYIEGHSQTEAYSGAPPTVEELTTLADKVDTVIKDAKKMNQ